jgi:hypothetical protein
MKTLLVGIAFMIAGFLNRPQARSDGSSKQTVASLSVQGLD